MSDPTRAPDFHEGLGFRALTELAPDLVAVIDVAGVFRYVSPSVHRILGYLPGELTGCPFLDFVHSDDRRTAREDWARLLRSDELFTPTSIRFRHKDGAIRILEALMKNYSGTPGVKGVLVSARDITARVANEKALRGAFAEISDLYNNAPCGYHSLDENGVIVRINDTELSWLGYARDEVVGKMRLTELLSPASLAIFERSLPTLLARRRLDNVEFELVRRDGSLLPILLSATAITDEFGRFVMSRATLYDITERKLAESALRKVNRALRVLNAINSELIRAEQELALIQAACRVCVDLAGYRLAWIGFAMPDAGKTVKPVATTGFEEGYLACADISWADDERGRGPTGSAIRTGIVQVNRDFLTDPRMVPWREDAVQRGYRSSIALPLKDTAGAFGALMIYADEPDAFDAGEVRLLMEVAGDLAFGILTLRARESHKRAEAEIQRLAFFDTLTGLPNRNRLLEEIGRAAEQFRSGGPMFALLCVNVIRFSDIQSGIGVRSADALLRQVAGRMRRSLRDGEMLARTGGDEFAVLLPAGDPANARDCGQRIEHALLDPFQHAQIPITVLVRIGAAMASGTDVQPEALLVQSGIAMRQAKRKGDSFALYEGVTEEEAPRHLALITELRTAIESGQLLLHYQPKIDLRSGRPAGVEALVRWQHPVRGLVPPGEFIPIAEQTGLIRPLTYSVLDIALRQCSRWKAQGFRMPVAVNVSANNFTDPDFVGRIESMLQAREVEASSLQLEITESVLMEEPAQTLETLVRLNQIGISVSIDDFGTGYSSLSYVASLPIEALKIDRSFIVKMVDSERTRSVVAATVALAQSLGIRTVAEGVESRDQARMLTAMGCSEIQGFFFCRPVEAEQLRRWTLEFSAQAHGRRLPAD